MTAPVRHVTPRLLLVEVDSTRAAQLARGVSEVAAVDGYPLEGTRTAAAAVLATEQGPARRPGFGMYQLVRREDDQVIGDIGFHGPPADGLVEIGYGLAPVVRGRGLCTEAVVALCGWALEQHDVNEIVATTDIDNPASEAVLVRAGFTLVERSPTGTRYRMSHRT